MNGLLTHNAHRPWPLPQAPWIMSMEWRNLLFMHWPIPYETLRPLIPYDLELDSYEGQCWIAVVPFRMANTRPRLLPTISYFSDFPELNVRTYVKKNGKAGVWFFSLDAANPLAVRVARTCFHLCYRDARMSISTTKGKTTYNSIRTERGYPPATLRMSYQPISPVFSAKVGTVEHWFAERYALYSADQRGRVYRGDIHHKPWPLQLASAEIYENTMTEGLGFKLSGTEPLLHFSERLDVLAWWVTTKD